MCYSGGEMVKIETNPGEIIVYMNNYEIFHAYTELVLRNEDCAILNLRQIRDLIQQITGEIVPVEESYEQ